MSFCSTSAKVKKLTDGFLAILYKKTPKGPSKTKLCVVD